MSLNDQIQAITHDQALTDQIAALLKPMPKFHYSATENEIMGSYDLWETGDDQVVYVLADGS